MKNSTGLNPLNPKKNKISTLQKLADGLSSTERLQSKIGAITTISTPLTTINKDITINAVASLSHQVSGGRRPRPETSAGRLKGGLDANPFSDKFDSSKKSRARLATY
jgi:hypothetical protein